MVSDIALLGFLSSEPVHGYEIYQRFNGLPGLWEIWRIKQSRLYAMLGRLEARDLIQADTLIQENRPAKKVFSITPNGKTAYMEWLSKPVQTPREFRLEFLVKLFFAIQAGSELKQKILKRQVETCNLWLDEEKQALSDLDDENSFESAIHQFRIGQISAMLEWLASIEALEISQVVA